MWSQTVMSVAAVSIASMEVTTHSFYPPGNAICVDNLKYNLYPAMWLVSRPDHVTWSADRFERPVRNSFIWRRRRGGILVSFTDSRGGHSHTDSVVATVTAFSQWSTVKTAQKGAVNGQSALKSMVNGRLQCGTDECVHTKLNSNSLQLVTRELKWRMDAVFQLQWSIDKL